MFADGKQIGQGCRIRLTGSETLSLQPGFFLLSIWKLSAFSIGWLNEAKQIEVRSGSSVLGSGDICDVHTFIRQGKQVTEVGFSPGMGLWESRVSLSLEAGKTVSESILALLEASGTGIGLAGFTGKEKTFSRAQAFYGRTVPALERLAGAAEASAWLSPAGVIVSGKADRTATVLLTEAELVSAPTRAKDRVILRTRMIGWPGGAYARYLWQGLEGEGRILFRMVEADNSEGNWKSELVIQDGD